MPVTVSYQKVIIQVIMPTLISVTNKTFWIVPSDIFDSVNKDAILLSILVAVMKYFNTCNLR